MKALPSSLVLSLFFALSLSASATHAQEMIEIFEGDPAEEVTAIPVKVIGQIDEETVQVEAASYTHGWDVPVVFSLRLSSPLIVSAALGSHAIIYIKDKEIPLYYEAEAGLRGGSLSIGPGVLVSVYDGSRFPPVVGFAFRATVLQSWNVPDRDGATYLGVQGDIALMGLRLTLGYLNRIAGDPEMRNHLFTFGVGYAVEVNP